jgi:hypothetical protein
VGGGGVARSVEEGGRFLVCVWVISVEPPQPTGDRVE